MLLREAPFLLFFPTSLSGPSDSDACLVTDRQRFSTLARITGVGCAPQNVFGEDRRCVTACGPAEFSVQACLAPQ